MSVRCEVIPFIVAAAAMGLVIGVGLRLCGKSLHAGVTAGVVVAGLLSVYMLYFFRDPERTPPAGESLLLAGADGVVAAVSNVGENDVLHCDAVRVSIFLSLFDVHVNRAPLAGKSTFLGYKPGKHFFTFKDKSSEFNQHNAILIEGSRTSCLVHQIVGPVCRRVVYWLDHDGPVDVAAGDRIGMMKFGSRLDMYFPRDQVDVIVTEGTRVRAGETVIAQLKELP